jgi:hypothetical protein
MKKIFVLTMICLALSLSVLAQKPKPTPCSFGVPANLVINPGTNITADGATVGGLYANGGSGRNNISVGLSEGSCSGGDFIVQLNNSIRYMNVNVDGTILRSTFANFDRVGTVPITTNAAAMNDFCAPTPTGGYKYDNYAGCGSDARGAYVRRNVGFSLANGFNLRFQESPIESPTPPVDGTAYIKVYHPDINTWVLEPEYPAVGALLSNGVRVGSPVVPFWFTVTRQNLLPIQ